MREAHSYINTYNNTAADSNTNCYTYTKYHGLSDSHCEPNAIRAISDTFTNAICNLYPYFNADYDATANSHAQGDAGAAVASNACTSPVAAIR